MKKSSILTAIFGVIIGVLLTLVVQLWARPSKIRVRDRDWQKVNLILRSIDENYVDSVDHKKVTDIVAEAALQALDPHSIYMVPKSLDAHEEDLAGNFDGIGIQFNVPNDTAIVLEVIPGGPSEKVGLKPGDRLLKVDTTCIAGVKFPQDSMVRRMKGKAGSKVNVLVKRDKETIPFEITRGKIPTHSVDAAFMVRDTVGYIRLSKFSRTTGQEFITAAADLLDSGMKDLIVDLRDNTGGFLDQALILSNLFLPKDSVIVYIEGLHRKREDYKADGRGPLKEVGLSLLIDENTASSSEIFAGAMQDNGRAMVVGRRSFGKGLVQEPFYFSDGSGMRITVARFHTPSGRCIQKPYTDDYNYEVLKRYNEGEMVVADSMKIEKGGIIPDVFVPMDTTRAGKFYVACNRKATAMRFASAYFDDHKDELSAIDDFDELIRYLDGAYLESKFLDFAKRKDGIAPSSAEWAVDRKYVMTQLRALVGRYSKLGDNAYYHLFLDIDDCFNAALDKM
ncbi:MAG: S41 family peptidase [Bacteroides sp.]|nr:S41 family peptidase [Bacteroides sp.]MDY5891131.1 S41 family peptidase [Candidatus Cryptobacteroides sp.]